VEELKELLELDILDLIKGAFHKEGIPGAPKEKEIAIPHGLVELGIKLLGMFFEKVMAAGIKARGIDGPHKNNYEISDAAG